MAGDFTTLLVEDRDHVRIITLNRPERLNALNSDMKRELPRCLEEAAADDAVRAVVLTGAGRGFCSGADLRDMVATRGPEALTYMRELQANTVGRILKMGKPVIAAVNGPAAGAGFSLALACDLILACRDAFFLAPFVHGPALIPDLGLIYLLPRVVGLVRAKEIMLKGERISAERAYALGMVTEVVDGDAEALRERALAAARRLGDAGPAALAMTKRLTHLGLETSVEGLLEYEALAQTLLRDTEDHREGVAAFRERREPRFQGR